MPDNQTASQLAVVEAKSNLLLVASDPDIPPGPGKNSVAVTPGAIRSGVKVVLSQANTPLAVLPGQTVYVDTRLATGPLVAVLPDPAPTVDDCIKFIPLGLYSTQPLHVDPGTINVDGEPGEIIEVTTDNAAFEVRHIDENYGYGFFSLGNTYLTQSVTVNASDLVTIRYVASGTIQLVPTDRESGVATLSNVAGIIKLPLADDVTEGWQCTIIQLGDGPHTFQLNDAATAPEELIALGDQFTTLGKGSFITVLLTAGKKWLIGGGLTGV